MPDDLTDIELAAEACPTESAGYCQRCKWSVGACTCSARYKFRYAATKERLLALVTELRGLRAAAQSARVGLGMQSEPCPGCGKLSRAETAGCDHCEYEDK